VTEETEKPKGKLTLGLGGGGARPGIGRSGPQTVTVEVRKKRVISKPGEKPQTEQEKLAKRAGEIEADTFLTNEEKRARLNALQYAIKRAKDEEEERRNAPKVEFKPVTREEEPEPEEEEEKEIPTITRGGPKPRPQKVGQRKTDHDAITAGSEPIKYSISKKEAPKTESPAAPAVKRPLPNNAPAGKLTLSKKTSDWDEEKGKQNKSKPGAGGGGRRTSKITVTNFDQEERHRSLASVKRQREKHKRHDDEGPKEKVIREVTIPETITVGDLANRMSEKSADVVRELMKLGIMATINQVIDADTAELVVTELGHKFKRVTDADVENVIDTQEDSNESLKPRPPVVTIMGHVDHGKTSLLDALRDTDVVSGEAGGITQHIGAYQVELKGKGKITFIDTPGHEAFTEMRARGAKVTDIVVLVVAADDGIMAQTVEAIAHAKAAGVPIIVAINKIDKPGADANRVRTELLSHELVTEEMGGEVLTAEVSAKQKIGLDKLKEQILLQAEVLDLKANPERAAVGSIIESRIDKGRGVVATVIVEKGTLQVGDIVVAATATGRVRALLDHNGKETKQGGPSAPVEILGLAEAPMAGDEFSVVENEKQAREISEYRREKAKNIRAAAEGKTAMEKLFSGPDSQKSLAVVIKGDVQGSIEAIANSLNKLGNEEIKVKVIHSAVGAVTESDVTLARASNAVIVAFNVRANAQARELAHRDHVRISYYSIIYEVVDDVTAILSGLLSPVEREQFIGYAEIREVFNISKVGKIAGCYVTEGHVARGAGVRLLRDNVVIHQGKLKTLKRFKDEVKEVQNGYECGMAFENYDDIKQSDVIECYQIIQEAGILKKA